MTNEKDTPGVIAPPPLIFLGGLISGGLIGWFYQAVIFENLAGRIFGGILTVFGLVVILVAKSNMSRAKTNIEPWKPTTAILTEGIYGISRNPVYVAMVFIYLGTVFLFNSLWLFPPLVVVLVVMHYGVIMREERYLERKFGREYLDYKKTVRRWV